MSRKRNKEDTAVGTGRARRMRPSPPHRRSSRTRLFVPAGLALVVIAAVFVWWLGRRHSPPVPNVVVFMLDTVRRDAVGCYGHPLGPTPYIDALAEDGVRFDQASSTSGWTLPAVASLLTGTWPTIHGALGKGIKLTPIRKELPLAPEVFKMAGFATVGFANAAFVSPMVGVDRGFDHFDHRYTYNWDARRADETIDAAVDELRRRRMRATFYFIHLFDAHLDYDPPAPYLSRFTEGRNEPSPPISMETVLELQTGENGSGPPSPEDIRYVRAVYDGEVAFADEQVGRFIDELRALGLYDRATIIVTADHGEEFWEHGGFEHGHTLYDELLLVPLIIKLPSTIEPVVREVSAQVRLIDVMPTVFDILDIDTPESFVGRSLLPLVGGEPMDDLIAFGESTLYGPPRIALRGPRFKYVLELASDGPGRGELYDWREDPGEQEDLSSKMPEAKEGLEAELMQIYSRNVERSAGMSKPEIVDLHPERIRELRSLGYIR